MTTKPFSDLAFPGFEFSSATPIDALNIEVQEFVYPRLGTRHVHLASAQDENVFLVALRTVPTDSTGVAHILEHTVLCGSQRFPVRDPFFMMTRRSLNTFMNAFTSSDWTAYPFASQNQKDFYNLLDVYLDSVFFANLHELDFAQEGHRVEFEDPVSADSPLVYKGVVYNEMKGAMSSPVSQLWANFTRHLFPSSTYHFNSGGDPEEIPNLSYEQLKDFYAKHYHPSNALFMTFGNIPAKDLQEQIHEKVLQHFQEPARPAVVKPERRYFAPLQVKEAYPLPPGEDRDAKTHIVTGWLLSESADLHNNLEAHLLTNVLLENSASPLMQALETTEFGHTPSSLCGLEDSYREMVFVCGLEGSESQHAEAVEAMIISVLERVAEEGVAEEKVAAVLHQLELSQREISGDSYPYGLQLILAAMPPVLQGGNPAETLDIESALQELRESIKDPGYIKQLVRKFLLDNPHRVTLTMAPDTELEARREQYTKYLLDGLHNALGEHDKQQIVEQANALQERQQQKDLEDVLPKVTLEDVPEEMVIAEPSALSSNVTCFAQGTNGLVYQQAVCALPALDSDDMRMLPLLSYCLPEVGAGDESYLDLQEQQSAFTGGINAYWEVKGTVDSEQDCTGYFVLSGKALQRNQQQLISLVKKMLLEARFDEYERLHELVSQLASRREQSVTSNGHGLAMAAATSGLSPAASVSHRSSGLEGIRWIKELDKQLDNPKELENLAARLQTLHGKIIANPIQFLAIAEEANLTEFQNAIRNSWTDKRASMDQRLQLPSTRIHSQVGWITNCQVSFCAKAYATVPSSHSDAPILTVLGHYLRNGYLHRAIREQGGAYGAGAGQDSGNAIFRFFSYRDPRIEGTLEDFNGAVSWLLNEEQEEVALEQAILGVVSSIDKPRSPAGEAKSAFHNGLFGRTPEQRRDFRSRVLRVSLEDLRRVAQTYLQGQPSSIAVVSGDGAKETFEKIGLEVQRL